MEFCFPPATHFIATVDYLIDVLDYGSEDIDGMDDDADKEQGQDPPFTGRWTATSSYDVYMVDTPKKASNNDKENPVANKPFETKSKRRRPKRRSKPRAQKMATPALEKIVLRATPKTTKTLLELHPNRRNMTTGKTTLMSRP